MRYSRMIHHKSHALNGNAAEINRRFPCRNGPIAGMHGADAYQPPVFLKHSVSHS